LQYDDQRLNAAAMVAGNVWNAGVVLGAPVSDWKRLDLAQVRATLSINGREIGSGTGGDVMGHPLNAPGLPTSPPPPARRCGAARSC
jgi:2-keto-4-pentenoate hydratase